ncbi:tRNA glutamyl-Q(34) synthetase GluQRS [Pontixanthobacter gangjinensis]|uniref:tRNA glutamyl-Q(34) synthetase GluQRS n=1 Tax=Pontixanthobacter gangjinensis TaxID=1028742 RepID=A0A6I4SIH2_9SPHN|nr:tRNA glutamyl-Q(34) synthetase GluQRS [Pontixanthobacter gangjinensis]MXO55479.1 tRNA glutamyl-Q(34) synthetase GluQRS [Pontixanthobacter gangjinensis]
MIVTRFAPSPNGMLHLGHAYSAIVAHDLARGQDGTADGRFLLRIEDIDGERSRPELTEAFREDLAWLGLEWEEVPPQSSRLERYAAAAERLKSEGLLYPCQCTRSEIAAAARQTGPEGPVYPGTCKHKAFDPGVPAAWRLNIAEAIGRTGPLDWCDDLAGLQVAQPELLGDVVLVRKDNPASYHLAATLDDAADAVTLVTRGQDLFAATHVHRLLQALLDLPVPRWHHHALVLDASGKKLAKRRGSASLADLRAKGVDGKDLGTELRAGRLAGVNSLSQV